MINYFRDKGVVSEVDIPIVLYGIKLLLITLVELFSVMLLAIWCGNFIETLFFLCGFAPLRMYAGGFHAKTPIGCYFVTIGVYFVFTFSLAITPVNRYYLLENFILILSVLVVYFFAPIVHNNKIIHIYESERYRIASIMICMIDCFLIIGLRLSAIMDTYLYSFSLGLSAVSVFMIIAIVENMINKRGGYCGKKNSSR